MSMHGSQVKREFVNETRRRGSSRAEIQTKFRILHIIPIENRLEHYSYESWIQSNYSNEVMCRCGLDNEVTRVPGFAICRYSGKFSM